MAHHNSEDNGHDTWGRIELKDHAQLSKGIKTQEPRNPIMVQDDKSSVSRSLQSLPLGPKPNVLPKTMRKGFESISFV